MIMTKFETQVYHKEQDDLIGVEVLVKDEDGESIDSLQITSKTDFDNLMEEIDELPENFISFDENSELRGMTLDEVLANENNNIPINALTLGGSTANQYSKTDHAHVKASITDLYNVDISSSSQNPDVGDTITLTVKLTNMSAQPAGGKNIVIYKNGSSWKSGTTNGSGIFTTTYVVDSDDPIIFKVDNQKLIVAPNPYWKEISVSKGTLKVCEKLRLACYGLELENISLTANVTYAVNNQEQIIPSQFVPPVSIIRQCHTDMSHPKSMRLSDSGRVFVYSPNTATTWATGYFVWHY